MPARYAEVCKLRAAECRQSAETATDDVVGQAVRGASLEKILGE